MRHVALIGLVLSACGPSVAPAPPAAPEPVPIVAIAPEPPPPDVDPVEPEAPEDVMDTDQLTTVLEGFGPVERNGNAIQLEVEGHVLIALTDERHDRMRLVVPVVEATQLDEDEKDRLLAANFHTALDARYAVHDGVLYSVFIHPLSPLTREQAQDAVRQVVTLAATFGASYSSGDLVFGSN